jgi:Asp-tRNA(Asn)/Glu-tRNA(Gln) amidotransferase C subunit
MAMTQPVQEHPDTSSAGLPSGHPLRAVSELMADQVSHVLAAVEDLQRVECLDEEQRAEVHAILEAIRHDNESQAAAVTDLMGKLTEIGDA